MYNQKLTKIEPLNEIVEGLFLGDHVAADNKYILSSNGITHVLTLGKNMFPRYPQKYIYKQVAVYDTPSANLKQYFTACHKFLKNAFAVGGRVLVHCWAGVSRSATIVISFLMKEHGLSLSAAT